MVSRILPPPVILPPPTLPPVYYFTPEPETILPLLPTLQMGLFFALLAWASITDVRKRIVPNTACIGIAAAGLLCFSPLNLLGALAAVPLLAAALCSQEGIGGGDVKLAAAAGSLLGFGGGVAGLILGLCAFLLFALVWKAGQKLAGKPKTSGARLSLPMAPFLSLGFFAAYLL